MKKAILISLTVLFIAACQSSVKVAGTSYKKADATAGQTIYDAGGKCAKCHKPKDVSSFTAEKWVGILKNMVPKAKLDETETKQVTAYVMVNSKKS